MSGDVTKSCYPQCPVFGVITRQRQGQFWQQPLFNSQYSENTFIAVPGDDTTYFLRSQDVNLYIYILSDRVIMSSNFFFIPNNEGLKEISGEYEKEAGVLLASKISLKVALLLLLWFILQEEYCCFFMSCSLYCFLFPS